LSTSQEGPALIQYACERCKTRFVLPPSSRQLSISGKFRALSIGIGRFFRYHEGVGAGYDTARRQLLAKMDDEAYQSFVQSFRFCHECRQFVCNECWSMSRRSCLTCVAKSMTGTARPRPPFAPTGPEIPRPVVAAVVRRRGRLRRDVGLVALALAIVLLSLEGGVVLIAATSGPGPTPVTIIVTLAPSTSPSLVASVIATATPTPKARPTATASPTATLSASPSATATAAQQITPAPTKAPVITPAPTAPPVITPAPTAPPEPTTPPTPIIACGPTTITTTGSVTCNWTNVWVGSQTVEWDLSVSTWGFNAYSSGSNSVIYGTDAWKGVANPYELQLRVTRDGVPYLSTIVEVTVTA
jgi:hypothetical protein